MSRFRYSFGRCVRRAAPLAILASTALAVCATNAYAADANTVYNVFGFDSPESQVQTQRFGERLVDANVGHGVRDLFASTYLANYLNYQAAGEVTLINTKDRSVLYEIHSPEPQTNAEFGFYVANIGDVNGNGTDDIAVGSPAENVDASGNGCTAGAPGCNTNQGKVYVFEGSTGKLLYAINSPHPQSKPGGLDVVRGFGARIGSAGDVNGDGINDIIIGAPSLDVPAGCSNVTPLPANCHANEGEAFIMSGKDGSLIRVLDIPAADEPPGSCSASTTNFRCGNQGGTVSSPGDVNGDGVPDQLVNATRFNPDANHLGRDYLYSGKDGSLLARIDAPATGANQFFGLQDVTPNTPGDVNGDGRADIYLSAFNQTSSAGPSQGAAWVFDGKATVAAGTGVVLYEIKDPLAGPSHSFGFSASATSYDKDGTPDIMVGGIGGPDNEVSIFDGADGSLLKTLSMPPAEFQPSVPSNSGSDLGWSSRSLGDVNGDGQPDYVSSAPTQDVGPYVDQGKLYFWISNVPAALTPNPTPMPSPNVPPAVSGFGLTNNPFVVSRATTPLVGSAARTRKHKQGTTFTYSLSKAATAKIVIAEQLSGRLSGRRCVAASRKLRKARKCTRIVVRGTLTRGSKQGANRVAFSGRIGSRALSPGKYQATITATDAAHANSKPKTISFTIVKV
ncbi:MAG: FG-GAP-like repeat-containing protein [Actinomycetota bacterium]|nr:FG-GAP-like repeat-containing protein [Actinomycetota bacterium]